MNESLTSVIIEGVSQLFGKSSEVCSPHQNKEKLRIILCLKTLFFFLYTASPFVQTQSCRFICVWGNFKYLVKSPAVQNGQTLYQRVLDACQTIPNRPGTFEIVRQSTIGTVHMCIDSGRGHLL